MRTVVAPVQSPKSEAHIAAMFDRIAPRYDLLNRLLSARQDQRWRKRLVSMIPYRPGGRYLDVATGTGDVLLAVAQARKEYAEFVGSDISPKMMAVAAQKAQRTLPKAPIRFAPASAEALGLPGQAFDCLSIAFGLRNIVKRDVAIREFHRVLAPGGVLLILEFFLPRRGVMAWLFQLYFHHILPFIGGLLSDKAAYKYLPESVGSFYEPEALRRVLYETGFTVEETVSYLFGACRLVKARRI